MMEDAAADEGLLQSKSSLRDRLESTLPLDDVVYAFGYGSGVFSQGTNDAEFKVVDVILVVRDSLAFHRANLALNPSHYFVKSARWCRWIQEHSLQTPWLTNPRLYFNVTPTLKYGVVSLDHLQDDLMHWKYLYIAGRLHKPTVRILETPASNVTELQEQHNLPTALAAALLLQDESDHADPSMLFGQIAALSYTGDPRVAAGAEDPDKIAKLVENQGRWKRLYEPIRREHFSSLVSDQWEWESQNPLARRELQERLPWTSYCGDSRAGLTRKLSSIVGPAARYQSMKGFVTAGPRTSLQYAYRKLSKGLLRR